MNGCPLTKILCLPPDSRHPAPLLPSVGEPNEWQFSGGDGSTPNGDNGVVCCQISFAGRMAKLNGLGGVECGPSAFVRISREAVVFHMPFREQFASSPPWDLTELPVLTRINFGASSLALLAAWPLFQWKLNVATVILGAAAIGTLFALAG